MKRLFNGATIFNQDIINWDVSNVTNMGSMFFEAKAFNKNIANWDFTNIKECDYMLKNAEAFEEKYNNGESLPNYIDEVKRWFNFNRDKMDAIDIKNTHGKKIDNFFSIIEKESKKIQEKDI
jgi:surface protein